MPRFVSPLMLLSPTLPSAVCSCLVCALLYNLPCKILLLGAVLRTGKFSPSPSPRSLSSISLTDSCHSLAESQSLPAAAWLWTFHQKFPKTEKQRWELLHRLQAPATGSSLTSTLGTLHRTCLSPALQPLITVFQVTVVPKGQLNNKWKLGTGIYHSCAGFPRVAGPFLQEYKFPEASQARVARLMNLSLPRSPAILTASEGSTNYHNF